MKNVFILSILFVLCFGFMACEDENTNPTLVIPTTYESANFATNAATEIAVVNQLTALTGEAKRGRNSANTVTKEALDNLFTDGNPSLSAVITSYFKGRLEGENGWFDELANASGGTYTPGTPTGQGGVFGTGSSAYLFDENGLEIEQLVEKGQFGATLYKHATDLASGSVDINTVDKLLAIFGATPAFSNSGSSNVAADVRDRVMANYAARRDKNDGNGLYSQIKMQFLKLKAAVEGGTAFNQEKEEALSEIKLLWEKVNAATIINYCHATIAKLSATSPTDNDKASALHAYGEAVGFTHGWRTIPQAHKRITDAQIEAILVLLNAPYNGTPTSYTFVTDAVNQLPKLTQVINDLKAIYQFTDQEIEDFKKNWVSEQGR